MMCIFFRLELLNKYIYGGIEIVRDEKIRDNYKKKIFAALEEWLV